VPIIFGGVESHECTITKRLLSDSNIPSQSYLALRGCNIEDLSELSHPSALYWEGPLAEYCVIIGESDLHIGYDSYG